MWSAGVILYQMLFGRRPFGHDQTQERILREDTIINARKVEFPSKPSVSNEAKVRKLMHAILLVQLCVLPLLTCYLIPVGRPVHMPSSSGNIQ